MAIIGVAKAKCAILVPECVRKQLFRRTRELFQQVL